MKNGGSNFLSVLYKENFRSLKNKDDLKNTTFLFSNSDLANHLYKT